MARPLTLQDYDTLIEVVREHRVQFMIADANRYDQLIELSVKLLVLRDELKTAEADAQFDFSKIEKRNA